MCLLCHVFFIYLSDLVYSIQLASNVGAHFSKDNFSDSFQLVIIFLLIGCNKVAASSGDSALLSLISHHKNYDMLYFNPLYGP